MNVAQALMDAGLIQFGWFEIGGETQPFALHLEMLASYPDLLQAVVNTARDRLDTAPFDRLLCPVDAIPLATAFSLATGIPLVYSRGAGAEAVFDLVGAYDTGHPALLIANTWTPALATLVSSARRVGLQVDTLLTILEVSAALTDDLTSISLLRLGDIARELAASGQLTRGHAQAVRDWLASADDKFTFLR